MKTKLEVFGFVLGLATVLACGKNKSSEDGTAATAGGVAKNESASTTATATNAKQPPSAGASDACASCRDDQCGSEVSTCKGDSACSKNLGCGDECKKDKACMMKCMKPNPKFAAVGKCIVAKCKSVCTS